MAEPEEPVLAREESAHGRVSARPSGGPQRRTFGESKKNLDGRAKTSLPGSGRLSRLVKSLCDRRRTRHVNPSPTAARQQDRQFSAQTGEAVPETAELTDGAELAQSTGETVKLHAPVQRGLRNESHGNVVGVIARGLPLLGPGETPGLLRPEYRAKMPQSLVRRTSPRAGPTGLIGRDHRLSLETASHTIVKLQILAGRVDPPGHSRDRRLVDLVMNPDAREVLLPGGEGRTVTGRVHLDDPYTCIIYGRSEHKGREEGGC